jgi:light-regulated signal transduction histidine kinase (bacteriophytochrome)
LLARVRTHLELARARRAWSQQLEQANGELEAFSYSVSHDLRAPLRSIDGYSKALLDDCADQLDATARGYLDRVRAATSRMSALIDDLLGLARVSRAPLLRQPIDLAKLASGVVEELRRRDPLRNVTVELQSNLRGLADPRLMTIALENLVGNAWKFSGKKPDARIEVGKTTEGGQDVFYVRDDGAGFDMAYAGDLFQPFHRLHGRAEFEGTGIGLATVQRIVSRHGGRIWAEAAIGQGAKFLFTLGDKS